MDKMNIVVTVNSKYMRYLYVMLSSLYENNVRGSICLYVVHPDFSDEDKVFIRDITYRYDNDVNFIFEDLSQYDEMPIHDMFYAIQLSPVIWYRLNLDRIIPDSVNRVLLLDVDVIVNKDISELYYIDMEECFFAATPNMCFNNEICEFNKMWYPFRKDKTHYNIGVMLWNLELIRKKIQQGYIFSMALRMKDKISIPSYDEELFNVLFGENKIYKLPAEKWNYIVPVLDKFKKANFVKYRNFDETCRECGIIHYAGLNPWQFGEKNEYYKLWWEYCKQTPFYSTILKECYVNFEKELIKEREIIRKKEASLINYQKLYDASMVWIKLLLNGEHLSDYLHECNCTDVVVYGVGPFGKMVIKELQNRRIDVMYGIDRNASEIKINIPVITPDELNEVPKIVVNTTAYSNEEIKKSVPLLMEVNMISAVDILKKIK